MEVMVWRVTPTWAASLACDHSRSARSTRRRVPNRRMRSPRQTDAKFGANLKPRLGPSRPQSGVLGSKGNRLNRTFERGGGDRTKSGSRQVPNSFSPLAFHADAPLYIQMPR